MTITKTTHADGSETVTVAIDGAGSEEISLAAWSKLIAHPTLIEEKAE